MYLAGTFQGYGMIDAVGHVDFYPNGGMDQPGCSLSEIPINFLGPNTVGRHLVACNHDRAIHYFTESLLSAASAMKKLANNHERDENNDTTITDCQFIGHECTSYEDFQKGSCFSCGPDNINCAIMGIRAKEYFDSHINKPDGYRENIQFYLNTGGSSPFCQFHYLLQIHLANPKQAERWVQGFLKANLYGEDRELLDINLTPDSSVRLDHGESNNYLITASADIGYLYIVELDWNYDHDINPLDIGKVCVLLCSDKIFVKNVVFYRTTLMNNALNSITEEKNIICAANKEDGYTHIESGKSKLFYKQCPASYESDLIEDSIYPHLSTVESSPPVLGRTIDSNIKLTNPLVNPIHIKSNKHNVINNNRLRPPRNFHYRNSRRVLFPFQ